MSLISHDQLVKMGERWARRNGFAVTATEICVVGAREQPDVIAFRSSASLVIEAKTSRADFLADRKKPERQAGGMGLYRFYICPKDLIQPHELPAGWGLIYVDGRQFIDVLRPLGNAWPPKGTSCPGWVQFQHEPDCRAERAVLFSICRRLGGMQKRSAQFGETATA